MCTNPTKQKNERGPFLFLFHEINPDIFNMSFMNILYRLFFPANNIHEKISPFCLVKSSAVFLLNSAEKS